MIIDLVTDILKSYNLDTEREGLKETPKRVHKFLTEWLTTGDEPEFNCTTFDGEQMDQMIVQTNIPFYSVCEHHLLPFFGTATVAYIPSDRIVGLSKLARIIDFYARRPQNQERITKQSALFLESKTRALGVGVVIRARHMCMEMRGIKAAGAETVTSYLCGLFKQSPTVRQEFLSHVQGKTK